MSTQPAQAKPVAISVPYQWDEWALSQAQLFIDQLNADDISHATKVARLQELLIAGMEFAAPDTKNDSADKEKTTADYAFDSALMQMQGMYALMREFAVPPARAANCAAHVESAIRSLHRESKQQTRLERDANKLDAKRHRYMRVTTTAVRDPATGERVEVTPEMYDAAIDSAMQADPSWTLGIKTEHLIAASEEYNDSEPSDPIDQHPAYFEVMDDIFTAQGWAKYHNNQLIGMYPDFMRDIFKAGLAANPCAEAKEIAVPKRISTQWLRELAQEAGFNVNMIDQIVVPAPHSDATPYLRRLLKLVAADSVQDE